MEGTTRRRLLLGGVAFGLTTTTASQATSDDTRLLTLGTQLDRLPRRVRRLRAKVGPGGDPTAWSRWSRAVSECAALLEQIAKEPAASLAGLAVKYRALLWQLVEDDVILDRAVRRRAVRLVARSKRWRSGRITRRRFGPIQRDRLSRPRGRGLRVTR
jgi:hypothetical protein